MLANPSCQGPCCGAMWSLDRPPRTRLEALTDGAGLQSTAVDLDPWPGSDWPACSLSHANTHGCGYLFMPKPLIAHMNLYTAGGF